MTVFLNKEETFSTKLQKESGASSSVSRQKFPPNVLMRSFKVSHQVYVARLGYCLCGFAVACWAPLIPILQNKLQLSTTQISTLVFTMGIGAVVGMLLSSVAVRLLGFKKTYAITTLTTAVSICVLPLLPTFETVFAVLVVFGTSVGCLEVSIVVFAASIEKKFRLMLMSFLFAWYSLGEVCGAFLMMLLLTFELSPEIAILLLISLLYLTSLYYVPRIMNIESGEKKEKEKRQFIRPRQPVISLALIVGITYAAGGAVLDWSGLYITQEADVPLSLASCGYAFVALFMLLFRIWSRPVLRLLGPFKCTFYGAILETIGFLGLVLYPSSWTIIPCCIIIGAGMANISPLSTSAAGHQNKMPLVSAISLVSICGYTGLLLGPAILGGIAIAFSLKHIFIFLSILTFISAVLLFFCKNDLEAINSPHKDIEV